MWPVRRRACPSSLQFRARPIDEMRPDGRLAGAPERALSQHRQCPRRQGLAPGVPMIVPPVLGPSPLGRHGRGAHGGDRDSLAGCLKALMGNCETFGNSYDETFTVTIGLTLEARPEVSRGPSRKVEWLQPIESRAGCP